METLQGSLSLIHQNRLRDAFRKLSFEWEHLMEALMWIVWSGLNTVYPVSNLSGSKESTGRFLMADLSEQNHFHGLNRIAFLGIGSDARWSKEVPLSKSIEKLAICL